MKKFFSLFILYMSILLAHTGQAQEITVTGKVTSAGEDSPLPGVNVLIKGTSKGTLTDAQGQYSIQASRGDVLSFSFIGFTTQEVPVGNSSTINVTLAEDVKNLQEVVVTALGIEQEKRSLGYAVQELNTEDIVNTKQQNVVNALQGQVAGVQITSSGGAPGQSARILIRGISSLDPTADNQPLFVVDGVPIDNSTIEPDPENNTPRGLSNRAADINPNDVESISVLKGAAATALYGVRAANGAVIVTTKKGQAGQVKVNLSSSVGFEEINKYPAFQRVYGQGYQGEYDPESFFPAWGAPIAAVADTVPGHQYYNNWKNAMRTGLQVDNTVSISGGSENATFYTSFSRLDQRGVIPFSDWDRTTAKLAGTVKFSPKFNVSGSMNYINSGGNRVPHDRFMERMVYWAVTQDVRDYEKADGTMKTYGNVNPLYDAKYSTFTDNVNRIIGNINLGYSPFNWLSINYRVGIDYYSDQREEIQPGPSGIEGEVALDNEGFLTQGRINNRDINSTLNLTFSKNLAENVSATLRLGNDIFDRNLNQLYTTGNNFVIPRFYNLKNVRNLGTQQELLQRRLVGVYGDLMLDYKNMLYLNITGRNDWSSTLPIENRSFFYPSVSAGFVFSDAFNLPEPFSYGKIRASWAQVGKDAPPYSTTITYTSPADIYPLDGRVGYTRNNVLKTSDLKPEQTTSIEFGADLRFFNDRLGLDFTWYQSNSRDQILSVPISHTTGYTEFLTNAGELRNRGIELILRGTPIRTTDFNWDVTLNFSRNRNTVMDIREGIETIIVGDQFGYAGSTATIQLLEGEPYGNIYGRSFQRYYPNGDPENQVFVDRDKPILIGADGFPVVNKSQLVLGNVMPKFIGGIRNSFSYKGAELSFLIDFRYGLDQYNQYGNFLSAFGLEEYSLNRNDVIVLDGVTDSGEPNTKPVFLGQGEYDINGNDIIETGEDFGAGYYRNIYRGVTENFVQDASFIKLRNVTLAYNFQPSLLENLPFSNARFSVAANNILLRTPWTGFDPESFSGGAGSNATGFSGLGYPGVRSLFFTLNLTF